MERDVADDPAVALGHPCRQRIRRREEAAEAGRQMRRIAVELVDGTRQSHTVVEVGGAPISHEHGDTIAQASERSGQDAYPGAPITCRRVRNDMTDHFDTAESAEKADAAEPMENADANDPTEPMERHEPIDPMDRTEPFEPIERSESSDHSDHCDREPDGVAMPPC